MNRSMIVYLIMQTFIFSAECGCTTELEDAFEEIEEHIFDDNVDKMIDALKTSTTKMEENIKSFKALEKEYRIYVKMNMLQSLKYTSIEFQEEVLRKLEK